MKHGHAMNHMIAFNFSQRACRVDPERVFDLFLFAPLIDAWWWPSKWECAFRPQTFQNKGLIVRLDGTETNILDKISLKRKSMVALQKNHA